jgi:hypothetical protein
MREITPDHSEKEAIKTAHAGVRPAPVGAETPAGEARYAAKGAADWARHPASTTNQRDSP